MPDYDWVEIGPRLYQVVVVPGYPTKNRRRYRCVVDNENQRIEVGDLVPEDERPAVIARAASGASEGMTWTLVPLMGRVR